MIRTARLLALSLLLTLCATAAEDRTVFNPDSTLTAFTDTRDNEGGPDNYGHTWRNSNHPAGPAFDWIELDGIGTQLAMVGNAVSDEINLGFEFPWYGAYQSGIYISTNGLVGFTPNVISSANQNLPNPANPNDLIAAFWDDLGPDATHGKILYRRSGGAFIVEWKDMPRGSNPESSTYTFELVLYNNGNILIQWQEMNGIVSSCTVGIENADASDAITYHINTIGEEVAAGMALMFYGPLDCSQVDCTGLESESEANNGWNDGLLIANEIYNDEPMCGSINQGDEDWFRFYHYGGNIYIRSQISEFDAIIELYPYTEGAEALVHSNVFGRCGNEALTGTGLNPGEYVIRLYSNPDSLVEGEQSWMLSVSTVGDCCDDPSPVECLGDNEQEPNAGWMAEPANASYNDIQPGISMCGSVSAHDGNRDYDWYRFVVDEISDVHVESDATGFDMMLFVTPFDPNGSILFVQDYAPPCCGELMNLSWMAPGEYFLVVSHNDWTGVPVPQEYSLTLNLSASANVSACNVIRTLSATEMASVYAGDSLVLELEAPDRPHVQEALSDEGTIACPGFDHVLALDLQQMPRSIEITVTGTQNADEVLWYTYDCVTASVACEGAVNANGADSGGEQLLLSSPQLTYLGCDFAQEGASTPLRVVLRDISIDVPEQATPMTFELLGAYPNPFNPSTQIRWQQAAGKAKLRIFDLTGRLVLDEDLGPLQAGLQRFTWRAGEQASGLYLFQLEAAGNVATGKMMLLK